MVGLTSVLTDRPDDDKEDDLKLGISNISPRIENITSDDRPTTNVTVLVIDDDRAVRDALVQTLELADCRVISTGSFVAAKDYISPDFQGIILSDIRMPGRDGFHVLNYGREVDHDLPVVLLTGEGDIPMAVSAMAQGAFSFLEKPCDSKDLMRVLERALRARAPSDDGERVKQLTKAIRELTRKNDELRRQRDEARAELARLQTEEPPLSASKELRSLKAQLAARDAKRAANPPPPPDRYLSPPPGAQKVRGARARKARAPQAPPPRNYNDLRRASEDAS